MRTTLTYTDEDVQRAYRAQERRLKKEHGGTLYEIAVEDLIHREHIEKIIIATFESIGIKRETS